MKYAEADPDARFFVAVNQRRLPVETAASTFRLLFKSAGLNPKQVESDRDLMICGTPLPFIA